MSTEMTLTFSRQVKDELLQIEGAHEDIRAYTLAFALMNHGQFRSKKIQVASALPLYTPYLKQEMRYFMGVEPAVSLSGSRMILEVTEAQAVKTVLRYLEEEVAFTALRGLCQLEASTLSEEERRGALRGLFLSTGSLSDPGKAYHLEIPVRRPSLAALAARLFEAEGLSFRQLERQNGPRLYLKEGQPISDFLALIGAHRAVLEFENRRIEKDLRNGVNRQVNCDAANSKKVASTAVRQIRLLEQLMAEKGRSTIPEELRPLMDLRIAHPEYSLRDLGEAHVPPLDRSAVQRRMQRLERLAKATQTAPLSETSLP